MTFSYDFQWPDSRYTIRYLKLIDSAVSGKWADYTGYTEKHHIVPKSLGGGNARSNIVKMPGWLHYHAHYWLMKTFPHNSRPGRSMIAAFRKMNISRDYQERPTKARLYEEMRKLAAVAGSNKVMSEAEKDLLRVRRTGVKSSPETKAKISAARKGQSLSEEHKRAIGESQKGRKDSPETKEKRAAHHRGAKRSDETRARMREGRKLAKERREAMLHTETSALATPASPNTET